MKFGKQLQTRQLDIPEYAASFVNYKALKKLIKQLSTTPTIPPQDPAGLAAGPPEILDPQAALQANRAKFFFRLERELEKVNAFYLQKEAELKLRLQTLLDKKRTIQSRSHAYSKQSVTFVTLQEGFQQFGNDLNKLQQFVEVNNTAFSKILKKWDKTSKSRTKELYLSRAVEVQPCFNRDVISEFSDQATTGLQELSAWAEGESVNYDTTNHIITGQIVGTEGDDTDSQILHAAKMGQISLLQEWIDRLRDSPNAQERFTRIFLAAIAEAPFEALSTIFGSDRVDPHAEDEINGRNCMHEGAIYGQEYAIQVGLGRLVNVLRADVYGRLPLHYACMYGRPRIVEALLQKEPNSINEVDHDNFTPLIHAIVHHHLDCVEMLLQKGARIDPTKETDHIPLNLACQHGFVDAVKLLLDQNARLLPDAEGLFPQHLVARSGQSSETLLLLQQHGADLDQRDKLYQWTPLFHAASEGHVQTMRTLLDCGVDASILDEKGYSALYYATWEGHLECMNLLSSVAHLGQDQPKSLPGQTNNAPPESAAPTAQDADGIPDFTLPPPIIPLRRYGHNFLDSKTYVQFNFESLESDAIVFYQDSKYPAARLTVSPKASDVIPRNIMLPLPEDSRVVSFQIDNVSTFTIDFDVYPTFGSKMIARGVALPYIFTSTASGFGHCCLPLFNTRIQPIGHISFSFQVIEPFKGMPLDITHFATYWRATKQLDSYPTGMITGSSLTGEYVQIFVQVTADGHAVLYPRWTLDHHGLPYPISKLTLDQYMSLASSTGHGNADQLLIAEDSHLDGPTIHKQLSKSFISLKDVLAKLPTSIHLDIEVLYPTATQQKIHSISPRQNMNEYVDAILKDVFEHARITKHESTDFMRSVVFSSYNPDVCTALNWKQPNYPVLLRNDLGSRRTTDPDATQNLVTTSNGHQSISVKEAVRIAQSNNFMGLMCSHRLLQSAPSLIESIKVSGLVLVVDVTEAADESSRLPSTRTFKMSEGIDGILRGSGVLRFNEVIDA